MNFVASLYGFVVVRRARPKPPLNAPTQYSVSIDHSRDRPGDQGHTNRATVDSLALRIPEFWLFVYETVSPWSPCR